MRVLLIVAMVLAVLFRTSVPKNLESDLPIDRDKALLAVLEKPCEPRRKVVSSEVFSEIGYSLKNTKSFVRIQDCDRSNRYSDPKWTFKV